MMTVTHIMDKLLYLGHSLHAKTQSTQFLVSLLKERHDVEMFGFDPYKADFKSLEILKGKRFRILVCFQVMLPPAILKKYIDYEKAVLFPMYDGIPGPDDMQWLDYREFNIISFSKTLHDSLRARGFSSHHIQYFPEPCSSFDWGDTRSAFFWNRRKAISLPLVLKLVSRLDVQRIHVHKALDPSEKFVAPPARTDKTLTYSTWFESKQQMIETMGKAAIYIQPRAKEGMGMGFLEAMAMGRCVIAPDNPTMNEYITHGETGFLYDLRNPAALPPADIRAMQRRAYEFMRQGHEVWLRDKYKILEWIASAPAPDNQAMGRHSWRKRMFRKKIKFMGLTLMKIEFHGAVKKYYLFDFIPIFKKPV